MIGLLIFLLGWVWSMIGLHMLSIIDPCGRYDDLTMGGSDDPSIVKFGLSILFWPIAAAFILARGNRW